MALGDWTAALAQMVGGVGARRAERARRRGEASASAKTIDEVEWTVCCARSDELKRVAAKVVLFQT